MTPVESFIAILVGYVTAYRRPDVDPKAVSAHCRALLEAASPIFKQLGSTRKTNEAALSSMGKVNPVGPAGLPSAKYAKLLAAVSVEMKPQLSTFFKGNTVSKGQARLARLAIQMLTPDTGTVDAKDDALDRQLTILPDRFIKSGFARVEPSKQHHHIQEAQHLVKLWTGRSGDARLGVEECKKVKEKDPDRYKLYQKSRVGINKEWQKFVRTTARKNGKPILIKTLLPQLKAAGITYHPFAGLDRLYVGEDCRLYESPIATRRLLCPIPPVGSRIEWNPKYSHDSDNTYVFRFKVPNGKGAGMTKAYTITGVRGRRDDKYVKVMSAIPKVPANRAKWIKDLMSRDRKKSMLGAMAELLFSQAARQGGPKGKVDDEITYGMSWLNVGHCRMSGKNLVIDYLGKDKIRQVHTIKPDSPENSQIIKVVQRCMSGKAKTSPLWTDPSGLRVTPGDVNRYLRSCGMTVPAHKFRHIRGTMLMKDLLAHARIPKGVTKDQLSKIVRGLAESVGDLLGHESKGKSVAGTAIKNYIVPSVITDFFKARGFSDPEWLPQPNVTDRDDGDE